ncbi:MAG: hypothetical protein JXR37_14980 [Kiritimatiellae bacterium]|nr:hypothetical protein [Kiritimatiellia bacterium]
MWKTIAALMVCAAAAVSGATYYVDVEPRGADRSGTGLEDERRARRSNELREAKAGLASRGAHGGARFVVRRCGPVP